MPHITDPNQIYFKDGIWGWAATLWERITSQGGRLFTALHGWDGAAWHRLPMLWGYSARWAENVTGTAVAAGNAAVYTALVAPDFVYVLQQVSYSHDAGVNKEVLVRLFTDGLTVALDHTLAAVSGTHYPIPVNITMAAGDRVHAVCIAPGAGKVINLHVWGYKMGIAE